MFDQNLPSHQMRGALTPYLSRTNLWQLENSGTTRLPDFIPHIIEEKARLLEHEHKINYRTEIADLPSTWPSGSEHQLRSRNSSRIKQNHAKRELKGPYHARLETRDRVNRPMSGRSAPTRQSASRSRHDENRRHIDLSLLGAGVGGYDDPNINLRTLALVGARARPANYSTEDRKRKRAHRESETISKKIQNGHKYSIRLQVTRRQTSKESEDEIIILGESTSQSRARATSFSQPDAYDNGTTTPSTSSDGHGSNSAVNATSSNTTVSTSRSKRSKGAYMRAFTARAQRAAVRTALVVDHHIVFFDR